jgi:hypothetical protein
VASKGVVFGLTRDLGRMSPRHGIKNNGVLPSATSRMSDLSPVIKKITRQYFDPERVADFVVALASEEYPVSGELFSVGGGRAARTTLPTVPGHAGAMNPEDYVANFPPLPQLPFRFYVSRHLYCYNNRPGFSHVADDHITDSRLRESSIEAGEDRAYEAIQSKNALTT